MIEVNDKNLYGVYALAGNSNDILTGVPFTTYNGTVIKSLVTGSTFLNVDTKEVKIYDRESNSWK